MENSALKTLVKVVGSIVLATMLLSNVKVSIAKTYCRKDNKHHDGGYDKAVKAIMDSDMLDSYKVEAVSALAVGRNNEYYEAVVAIVMSDMLDSSKVELIEIISK